MTSKKFLSGLEEKLSSSLSLASSPTSDFLNDISNEPINFPYRPPNCVVFPKIKEEIDHVSTSGLNNSFEMHFINYDDDITPIQVTIPLVYFHGVISNDGNVNKFVEVNNEHWPIVSNEFKAFVPLRQGDNKLNFQCGEQSKEITVHYTRTENKKYVQPIYIICQNTDGSFIAPDGVANSLEDAVNIIKLNIRLIQTYFAESLFEHGFHRKSFFVPEDDDGEPIVTILMSCLDIKDTMDMSQDDLYRYFYEELSQKMPFDENRKFLCFMSCTRYFPPADQKSFTVSEIMSFVRGHAALGGGTMALFGTGSFHTWATSLNELVEKFSDDSMIDRTVMFDDSCGRGTHWANYSTSLGATVHELGHCFDLAHTKHGIMCRGHDDMNCFFTVVKRDDTPRETPSPSPTKKCCLMIDNLSVTSADTETGSSSSFIGGVQAINDNGKYKGAHWYRSSSVLLNYHKWFNANVDDDKDSDCSIKVSFHDNLLGPIGNIGSNAQVNQVSFNTKQWMIDNDLTKLVSVVFYSDVYLEAIQFIAAKYINVDSGSCEGELKNSPIYGTPSANCSKVSFDLDTWNEHITVITLRAGAWIDGLQLTTNLKSSQWIGGKGGDVFKFAVQDGSNVDAWIGSAGKYVGSLAFLTRSCTDEREAEKCIPSMQPPAFYFESRHGVRLVELYDNKNGEVCFFKEFLQCSPPQRIDVKIDDDSHKEVSEGVCGTVWDDRGNKTNVRFDQTVVNLIRTLR